ncbi:MAG: DUF4115 domain-containing protein [Elusimicrobiota bacterium]|jgi:cytoskeletal protein RodZ|nr:DUF4115 domain-containing protein [Elusimicrobiota bacterium]
MKEIGQILKETREAKGISYDEIYEAEKIQHKYLEAIENGDTSVFTALVYYNSFAKSYAKYLGLNFDELLKKYQLEKAQKEELEAKENNKDEKSGADAVKTTKAQDGVFTENFKDKIKSKRRLFLTILLIAVSAAGVYFYSSDTRKPGQVDDNNDNISMAEINDSVKRNTDNAALSQEKNVSAKPVLPPPPTVNAPPSPIQNLPLATIPSAGVAANTATAQSPSPVRQQSAAPAQSGGNVVSLASNSAKQSLSITALDTVWIGVRVDGETVFEGDLPLGSQMAWEANETFRVRVGKGLAVRILFNGSEIDQNTGMNPDSTKTLILRRQR